MNFTTWLDENPFVAYVVFIIIWLSIFLIGPFVIVFHLY